MNFGTKSTLLTALLCISFLLLFTGTSGAQVSITTYRGDSARSGVNAGETALTPSNVNTSTFGKLFSATIPDGEIKISAQPLYLSNVAVAGQGTHNVVYVATNTDKIHAFDADGTTTTPLWTADLSNGGKTIPCADVNACYIAQYIGIVSTPVIDQATGTLYAIAQTEENSAIVQRLHAIDVASGAEKFGGPVVIRGSVAGTGTGSSAGTIVFDSRIQNQRTALLLANGRVYVAFGSYGDSGAYHGWVMAYDAATLAQVAIWNTTPNGDEGGIWAPGNLAADSTGNIYATVGNGDSNAKNGGNDYGDSVVKLDASLKVLDYFMPPNVTQLNDLDLDLNGGGFVLSPSNILLGGGKDGTVLVIDGNHLGGWSSSGSNVIQSLPGAVGGSGCSSEGCIYSVPTLFNGRLYYIGQDDIFKAFTYNGTLSGPTINSSRTYNLRGAPTFVSSSGTTNGIVWAVFVDQPNGYRMTLYAYDAANPATMLWNSDQVSSDNLSKGTLFMGPIAANGKVYVAGQGILTAFGAKTAGSSGGTGGTGGGGGTGGTTGGTTPCAQPTSPGVNICAPASGATVTSPFTISAAGKNTNATSGLDVWLDGVKVGWYPSTSINIQVSAATGSHQLDVYAVGVDGELKETTVQFSVGTTSSSGNTAPFGVVDLAKGAQSATSTMAPSDTLTVVGWSADKEDGAPVSRVSVLIDGKVIGNARLGDQRLDVANYYSNPAYTYSGWSLSYPAANISAGNHTITAVAYDSQGLSATLTGTLNISVTAPNGGGTSCSQPSSPGVVICAPASGSTVSSPVQISAAGRNSGTTSGLDVWIDGSKFGWFPATTVSTTVTLASGSHQLDIYAVGTNGELKQTTSTFTVATSSVTGSNTAPFGFVDGAKGAQSGTSTMAPSDTLTVVGWSADKEDGAPVNRVPVLIDGKPVGNATLGDQRVDVANYYNNPAYTYSGWTFSYPAANLSAGTHTITAVAYDSQGLSATLGGALTISVSGTSGTTGGTTTSCSQPSSPGVVICSPVNGSTVNSPVQINAAGRNAGATDGMDVYIDGHHTGWYGGVTSISISIAVGSGAHQLDVYAAGVDGSLQKSTVLFTVP